MSYLVSLKFLKRAVHHTEPSANQLTDNFSDFGEVCMLQVQSPIAVFGAIFVLLISHSLSGSVSD